MREGAPRPPPSTSSSAAPSTSASSGDDERTSWKCAAQRRAGLRRDVADRSSLYTTVSSKHDRSLIVNTVPGSAPKLHDITYQTVAVSSPPITEDDQRQPTPRAV
jgi:hypothetical protein